MVSVSAMDMPVNVKLIMSLDCISVIASMEHVGDSVNNAVHCLTMLHTLNMEWVVLVS